MKAAAKSAGQIRGAGTPDGRSAIRAAATHRPARVSGAVEHRPAGERRRRHGQGEHARGVERVARGQVAGQAVAEHGQEVHEGERQGHVHREGEGHGLQRVDGGARAEDQELEGGQDDEVEAERDQPPAEALSGIPRRRRRRPNASAIASASDGGVARRGRRRARRGWVRVRPRPAHPASGRRAAHSGRPCPG